MAGAAYDFLDLIGPSASTVAMPRAAGAEKRKSDLHIPIASWTPLHHRGTRCMGVLLLIRGVD